MEVHPEDSDGSIDVNGNPHKTTTEVTSNIMVKRWSDDRDRRLVPRLDDPHP